MKPHGADTGLGLSMIDGVVRQSSDKVRTDLVIHNAPAGGEAPSDGLDVSFPAGCKPDGRDSTRGIARDRSA